MEEPLLLFAAVVCEVVLMAFIFSIARFYEQKFGESTHELLFLVPMGALVFGLPAAAVTGLDIEWAALLTNACSLLVLMTAGLMLYKKMMGVAK
jgi:hypothetical protein